MPPGSSPLCPKGKLLNSIGKRSVYSLTTKHTGTIARGASIVRVEEQSSLHFRLPAEQVMVSGWEMVHQVHELPLQHMVVVLPGHGTVELHVPDT